MYRWQFSRLSWALLFWPLPWWGNSWIKKWALKYLQCLAKMLMRECGCKPHSHLNITMYQMKNPDSSRMRNCTLYDQIFCISKLGLKSNIILLENLGLSLNLNKSNLVNLKKTTVPWKTIGAPKVATMIDLRLVWFNMGMNLSILFTYLWS